MDLREIGWGSVEWIQSAQDKGQWGSYKYSDEPMDFLSTVLVAL
jgi:hypothetical protein